MKRSSRSSRRVREAKYDKKLVSLIEYEGLDLEDVEVYIGVEFRNMHSGIHGIYLCKNYKDAGKVAGILDQLESSDGSEFEDDDDYDFFIENSLDMVEKNVEEIVEKIDYHDKKEYKGVGDYYVFGDIIILVEYGVYDLYI